MTFPSYWVIIPTDELSIIFQRGRAEPPTSHIFPHISSNFQIFPDVNVNFQIQLIQFHDISEDI